jgi:hypothetical protein
MSNYFICTRNIKSKGTNASFGNEPGDATFLVVPDNADEFVPQHRVSNEKNWLAKLLAGKEVKDLLVYVHGYNMDIPNVVRRHKILKEGLQRNGWKGELVTFAWPSATKPLLYLEDRHDAKKVSMELVDRGLRFFAQQVLEGCSINIHILAHSTGAFIVRESFCDAQSTAYARDSWTASQIVLIGGDISSKSMEGPEGDPVYKHCVRLTNYFNNYDSILGLSSVKRLGLEDRVGRVGLPYGSPVKAVDVNCSEYYKAHEHELKTDGDAIKAHAWYFWSDVFLKDLVYTLNGDLDRHVIPTRDYRANEDELYMRIV